MSDAKLLREAIYLLAEKDEKIAKLSDSLVTAAARIKDIEATAERLRYGLSIARSDIQEWVELEPPLYQGSVTDHAYKPPLGKCQTCGRTKREHQVEKDGDKH